MHKRHRNPLLALAAAMLMVLGVLGLAAPAANAVPNTGVVIGASGGPAFDALKANVGGRLAEHRYGQLDGAAITDAKYVNIEVEQAGTAVTNGSMNAHIDRWALALKATGVKKFVSIDHEPETGTNPDTPAVYKAMFRYIVNRFGSKGVTNVLFVHTITYNGIVAGTNSEYYPGPNYVDLIGSNVFNRVSCAGDGWIAFGTKAQRVVDYADPYNKQVIFSEFGSSPGPNRAHWLEAAANWIRTHDTVDAAFYFTGTFEDGCGATMALTTQAEFDAMEYMVDPLW